MLGEIVRWRRGDVAAVLDDASATGTQQAADGADERGLARAVGADQGHGLAVADL